ncbi:hypothetical protein [Actinopolymorpha pittospori]|uniref:Secreted protein n=1 Tax=Actinopolymorpha pittospori TaxID=648752 RepID=A0A927MSX2_9ACTN|nr:hypothetical protein [Actinopolymorpha pittospori]MBE1605722.1 hypothetical protein [Actinopolymorpha pittospori]
MNTATKLGAFALGLAVVFGGAVGLGRMVGPVGATAESSAHAGGVQGGHDKTMVPSTTPANTNVPGGLQISQDGYTLTPQTTTVTPGRRTDFRFTVTGPDGRPVTRYATLHEKELHFIVVRRDLSGFQHLHPVHAGNGVWSVPLTLPAAGNYRAFADFQAYGVKDGVTLGMDLSAPGDFSPKALPRRTTTASVDGYAVALKGNLVAGRTSKLTLTVSRDGKPVTDLQPYLGAYGHLVALRAGDLAYLHVHPDGEPGDGKTKPGPAITFYAEVPSAGSYRLYLDFQHRRAVRTAEFTAIAHAAGTEATSTPSSPSPSDGDDEHGH